MHETPFEVILIKQLVHCLPFFKLVWKFTKITSRVIGRMVSYTRKLILYWHTVTWWGHMGHLSMWKQRHRLWTEIHLCHTVACFHMISISLISGRDHPLCALLLCSMTHYDITMATDVTRDINCDATMDNDADMCT